MYSVKNVEKRLVSKRYAGNRNILIGSLKCIYKGEEYYYARYDECVAISKNRQDNIADIVSIKDVKFL